MRSTGGLVGVVFMRAVHRVEPYGKPPSRSVTLYNAVPGGAGSVGSGVPL